MMRNLLADRFGLKVHRETRVKNVFTLVVAKGGPKFQPAQDPSAEPQYLFPRMGEFDWRSVDLTRLIAALESHTRETVLDRTGLTGKYDFKLSYFWNENYNADQPPLPEAVESQLGLKLKPAKEPIEMLVID